MNAPTLSREERCGEYVSRLSGAALADLLLKIQSDPAYWAKHSKPELDATLVEAAKRLAVER